MPVALEPSLVLPEEEVRQEDVIAAISERYAGLPELDRAVEVMRNVGVQRRRLLGGLDAVFSARTFGERNRRFSEEAVALGTRAARQALATAELEPADLDALIFVSCTGYMLPGPDAHIANELGCRTTMRRLPIQQMGCAAGGTALGQAWDYLRGEPGANVLIVAVELCSLSFQPDATSLSDFISNGLFGDAAAACVVRGDDEGQGLRLIGRQQHLLPDSLEVIAGDTTEAGFHFATHPSVRRALPKVLPDIREFLVGHDLARPAFCVCHTGGPAILDAVERGLDLDPVLLAPSRASLASLGNVSSVVVFDVLRRMFAQHDWRPGEDDRGVLLAFGPGFTTEMVACAWQEQRPRRRRRAFLQRRGERTPLTATQPPVKAWT